MPIHQAIVRVRHEGINLSNDSERGALDKITERLSRLGATGQLSDGMSEFTLSLPSATAPADTAQRAVEEVASAFYVAGYGQEFRIVRVDAWDREEWLREKGLDVD